MASLYTSATTATTYSDVNWTCTADNYYTKVNDLLTNNLSPYLYKKANEQTFASMKYTVNATIDEYQHALGALGKYSYKTDIHSPYITDVKWDPISSEATINFNSEYSTGSNVVDFDYIKLAGDGVFFGISKIDEFKTRIRNQMVVCHKTVRSQPIPSNVPENEKIAIETLREFVSESEYRRYLRYGFVLVKGQSGDTFQIFRNKAHTKVWRGGTLVEEVCVRIADSSVPPTDNVIAFKTMIEADEQAFKSCGNVYRKLARAA